MNLKDFKIKSETDENFHMSHPDGSVFSYDKKKLSPKAMNMIKKMCSGGEVKGYSGEDGSVVEPNEVQLEPGGPIADGAGVTAPQAPQSANQTISPEVLMAAQKQAASMPATGGDQGQEMPNPVRQSPDVFMQSQAANDKAMNSEKNDIRGYQGDLKKQNDVSQEAFDKYQQQTANMPTPLDILNANKAKDDQLRQHYIDGKIDPNRYVNNMSTGSKILSGIAMIIGGAGAGAHGQNLAVEQFRNAVNNDIESQKTDQSKALNLYKMNLDATKDEQQAQLMTQNQMYAGVQAKLAQVGANTQNLQARFQATQAIHAIDQEMQQNRLHMSLLQQGAGGNGSSQIDPLNLVPQLVPKEQQPAAIKEIGQAQSATKNEDQMLKLFDEAAKENTVVRSIGGLRTPGAILSLRALGSPLIHDQDGRVNEFEQKNLEGLFPQPGDMDSKVKEKREGLQMFINNKKAAPTAKTYGINIGNFASSGSNPVARMSPQLQQYYSIAKAHPNDPASQAFFNKYGVR